MNVYGPVQLKYLGGKKKIEKYSVCSILKFILKTASAIRTSRASSIAGFKKKFFFSISSI